MPANENEMVVKLGTELDQAGMNALLDFLDNATKSGSQLDTALKSVTKAIKEFSGNNGQVMSEVSSRTNEATNAIKKNTQASKEHTSALRQTGVAARETADSLSNAFQMVQRMAKAFCFI